MAFDILSEKNHRLIILRKSERHLNDTAINLNWIETISAKNTNSNSQKKSKQQFKKKIKKNRVNLVIYAELNCI